MDAGVGAANRRDGRTAGNDELIVLALMIRRVGLSQHHVIKVKSQLTHVRIGLVDGQLTRADSVEGRRVAVILEVGAVVAGAIATRLSEEAADAETRSARSGGRTAESGAIGGTVTGTVVAAARSAGIVLEAHNRE